MLTLHGSGAGSNDIGGSANKMHFIWQDTPSSTSSISAKAISIYVPSAYDPFAKRQNDYPETGLLMQSSNQLSNDNAAAFEAENPFYALVAQNPTTVGQLSAVNVFAVYRTATDGVAATSTSITLQLPFWMKIIRSGSVFSAYVSSDGNNWTLVPGSTATISGFSLGSRVGLAGTGQLRRNTTATFSGISLNGIMSLP
jgi:hypothetical protein